MERIATKELALALGVTTRCVQQKATRGELPYEVEKGIGAGGRVMYFDLNKLPKDVQKQVVQYRSKNAIETTNKEMASLKEYQREIAYNRFQVLQHVKNAFLDAKNEGLTKGKILETWVSDFESGKVDKELLSSFKNKNGNYKIPTVRTIQRWMFDYNQSGGNISSLAPHYGKREGQVKLTENEKAIIANNFCQPHGRMAMGVFKQYVNTMVKACGWMWKNATCAVDPTGRTISYPTIRRFINATISYGVQVLTREGDDAFEQKCLPSNMRDYRTIKSNKRWNSDGHTLNLFCKNDLVPSDLSTIGRPTIVVWKDMASRKIMGFAIDMTENKELVSDAFADAIKNNDFVIPEIVYIDNGKAYRNKANTGVSRKERKTMWNIIKDEAVDKEMKGLFGRLGVEVSFALPYHAQSKPVERFWGTLDGNFSRLFPTYTGKNTTDKPENLPEIMKNPDNIPLLSEVIEQVREYFEEFNNTPHTGHDMNGQMPSKRYIEKLYNPRKVSEKTLALTLLPRDNEPRKVNGDGIKFRKWFYRDENSVYQTYIGKKVRIAYDPKDFNHIYALDNAGRLLFKAYRKERTAWDVAADAGNEREYRALKREQNNIKKLTKKRAESIGKLNAREMTMEIAVEKVVEKIDLKPVNTKEDDNLKDIFE